MDRGRLSIARFRCSASHASRGFLQPIPQDIIAREGHPLHPPGLPFVRRCPSCSCWRHGLSPTEVDIDQDPQLRERYDCCVPVVEIDGRERFRGRVDERLLRRLLTGNRVD